jgi:hypothetical protein
MKKDFAFILTNNNEVIIQICEDGKIFIRGELVDDNLEVYEAFKEWLERASKELVQ